MKSARAKWEPAAERFQSCAARMEVIGWKETTFLKKENISSPAGVWGKYVNVVSRLGGVSEMVWRDRKG